MRVYSYWRYACCTDFQSHTTTMRAPLCNETEASLVLASKWQKRGCMRVTEKIKQEVSCLPVTLRFGECDSEIANDKSARAAISLLLVRRNLGLLYRRYGELSDEEAQLQAAQHDAEYQRQPEWMGDVRQHHRLIAEDMRRMIRLRQEVMTMQFQLGNEE